MIPVAYVLAISIVNAASELKKLARWAFNSLGCAGWGRIDVHGG